MKSPTSPNVRIRSIFIGRSCVDFLTLVVSFRSKQDLLVPSRSSMKYSPVMHTTWLILFTTTIAPHLAAGIPTRRDNPVDGKTVDSLLFQAFDDFFKSQGLGGFNSSIYRQEHPWRLVDFLQDGGNHTLSPLAANATVYDLAESFPSDDQDKTTFAEEYITFVMDAGKALGLDDVNPPPNVASAANQSEELCSEALNVASDARLYYGKLAGKPVIGNDPDFQDWLFTENTTYIVAKQKCNAANMKYQNALTGEYSAEVRRLMPTFQRINKLNNAGSAIPGITMQVAGDPNEKVVSSDDSADVAPLVSMPGLDQSIEGWSKEEPGFEWDSDQADSSQDASSVSTQRWWVG
ncbi:hypothetical protein VKT23_012545 [Stygiomarasmius scandens]|uniref:Uncharacterized protein n=1 Tax=Marasmiellus scandens TaxID=2682957 RepID=A0ABR1J8T4_9AGAR